MFRGNFKLLMPPRMPKKQIFFCDRKFYISLQHNKAWTQPDGEKNVCTLILKKPFFS